MAVTTMRASVVAPRGIKARATDRIEPRARPSAVEPLTPIGEITVVVPAFNEEQAISAQIRRIRDVMDETGWRYEVIVVDDASTDGTATAVAKHPVRLIRLPENKGYGAAIKRSACRRGLAARGPGGQKTLSYLASFLPAEALQMLRWVALPLGLLAWSVPAFACVPPVAQELYRIEHETFGHIGRQVLTFRCDGDQLVVDTTVNVAVRMLSFTIYRHEAHYRAVWEGDRLARFESHTDDNGKIEEVLARAAGERVIIDGPKGQSQAPLSVVPTPPGTSR